MKLALLTLPGNEKASMPNLGVHYLAAYMNKNSPATEVKIFDFSFMDITSAQTEEILIRWSPEVIGISIYSNQVITAYDWGKRIKQLLPDVPLFCGGPHITLMGYPFFMDANCRYDFGIRGEGELPLKHFIDVLQADNSEPDFSTIAGLIVKSKDEIKINQLPLPHLAPSAWANPLPEFLQAAKDKLFFTDKFEQRIKKAVALTSSRGCPYSCSFCAIVTAENDAETKEKWRGVDASTLVSWIKEVYAEGHFEHVYLLDANFFTRKRRVLEFSALLYEAFGGKVTWSSSSTVGYIINLKDDLENLRDQGLRMVEMGIESGSQSQLNAFNKHSTVEQNLKAITLLRKARIDIGLDFIMFYPQQTIEELAENIAFIIKAGFAEHENFDHLINMLMLYPGTASRKQEEVRSGVHFSGLKLPDSLSLVTDKKIRYCYENFVNDFVKKRLASIESLISTLKKLTLTERSRNKKAQLHLLIMKLQHLPLNILIDLVSRSEERPDFSVILAKYAPLFSLLNQNAEDIYKEYLYE